MVWGWFGSAAEAQQQAFGTTGLSAVYGSSLIYHWIAGWSSPDWTDSVRSRVLTNAGGAGVLPTNTTTPTGYLSLVFDADGGNLDSLSNAALADISGSTGQQIGFVVEVPASGYSDLAYLESGAGEDVSFVIDDAVLTVSSVGGTIAAPMTSSALSTGWHTVVLDLRSGTNEAKLYIDGVLADTETATHSANAWDWTTVEVGTGVSGLSDTAVELGSFYIAAKTSGDWTLTTDAEAAHDVLYTYIAYNAYELIANQATFTRTGNSAGLTAGRKLDATQATVTLTRNSGGLTAARSLVASQASFTLTGNSAGLAHGYRLDATQATFTLSGINASLENTPTLAATQATFTLTGQSTGLSAARLLTATQASFALSGQQAALGASRGLVASQASFTLTGNAADLAAARKLDATAGSIALSGVSADLLRAALLEASQGTLALTGNDAELTYSVFGSYSLTAQSGSFVLTGNSAVLFKRREWQIVSNYSIVFSSHYAETSASVGKGCVVARSTDGEYVLASSANLSAGAVPVAVALTTGTEESPGVVMQYVGEIDSSVVNLAPGADALARVSIYGRVERVTSPTPEDWVIGRVDVNGNVLLNFGDARRIRYGTAAPTSGAWTRGTQVLNVEPSAGGNVGWVCVASGSPGTWKTFGDIAP
jgi:hypothetical protein